ncbi:orotidine-5'-phosphate decarboxylase [Orenia marismortui]|uniref:Orotidine 5'-phosphate decarboxylase n=1 Tax=Orenia marismortui TaxID=46469 RepID=A0A4R8H5Z2_9FIRM|nr:orotidine-5'-phosphate decarboxylase [Orenia marismortui]TDX52770.1 orotidine-5'-phosphate decarboxylase [Orenia marismortui]
MNFADRLMEKIDQKQSHVCVGLDPRLNQIPENIKDKAIKNYGKTTEAVAKSFLEFNKGIIDAVAEHTAIVKPQMAFYEQYGYWGVKAFEDTVAYAKDSGLLVISDAKRNDIGSTAKAYADGYLGRPDFWEGETLVNKSDSLTVTPYLGSDGIIPFVDSCQEHDKGIFTLVKTSNPSSGDLQDLVTKADSRIYEEIAKLVVCWGEELIGERGYSSIGAVVGATYPSEARTLREIMVNNYFLVPGYGAQGGSADDVIDCFNDDGYGAVVNSSRGIIFAYQQKRYSNDYKEAAKQAVIEMKEAINNSLAKEDKLAWQ